MNDYENRASDEKYKDRGLIIYLAIVFVSTYIYEYFAVIRVVFSQTDNYNIANIPLRLSVAMFIPAAGALAARLITGEGFREHRLSVNLKDRKYVFYLLAWFAPSVLTVIGCLIYFIVFREDFSVNMEYIIGVYESRGVSGITPQAMRIQALSQGITAIILGPIVNCITCFGEEWGWRGYLVWKLKDKLKPVPLMLVTGVIWGLWHLPLTVAGHNYNYDYPGYPYTGVLAMIVFCISLGTLLSYVTLKTGSCIPAIIGHGAINSFSAIGVYFTNNGGHSLFGPSPAGLIAGLPFLIMAVILMWLMVKDDQKEK
jgi:membrane protease YdiL (CAAX protease family)